MDPLNVQMIIDGCLVNNRKAREYLFHQVYAIGLPLAARFAGDDETTDQVLGNAYLHILGNLPFFDRSKLGFKSWVGQVVTDMGIAVSDDPRRNVFILHVVEGYNALDISRRLSIPVTEVQQLIQEGSAAPCYPARHEPERVSKTWAGLVPQIEARFSSDELVSMPVRALAKERITQGGWIGWSILIGLTALALVALHFAGVLPGKTFRTRQPPVTHVSMGLGYALPCPNH